MGMTASDGQGAAPLDLVLEVADELDLPAMRHLDNPPPGRLDEGNFEFTDVEGLIRTGSTRLTSYARVLGGRWHNS